MKELSIEEKAKAYDEALEKLRDFYRDYDTVSCLIDVKEELANLFPELKESEDERIKKEIISFIQDDIDEINLKVSGDYDDRDEDDIAHQNWCKKAIAWLEKQGKEDSSIQQAYEWGYTEGKRIERKHWIEKQNFSEDYNSIDPQFGKPIEQKPIDKVEPFDKYEGLTDFERTLADICIGWIGQELGWKQYIKDNADVLLKIAIEKFNSVQDAPFEQKPAWSEEDMKEALRTEYEKGRADAIAEMRKKWSDSKSKRQEVIRFLESLRLKED